MIVALLSWVYIFFITYSLGLLGFDVWKKFWPRASALLPAATLLSLTGFCLLAALLGIYSLFLSITQTASFTLFFLLLGYAFWRWRHYAQLGKQVVGQVRSLSWYWWVFLGVFFVKVLFLSVSEPVSYDIGYYYAQTLRWLEAYPVVPGLGNLHGRLAFNSSFFQVSALFTFSSLLGQPILVLNGYLYLLLAVTIVQFGRYGQGFLGVLGLLLLFLTFTMFSFWLSSGAPDTTIMVLEVFIFMLLLEKLLPGTPINAGFTTFLVLLLLFTCLSVKLSAFPVVGVLVYLVYTGQVTYTRKWLWLMAGLGFGIMAPWFARNIIQTGYLVYPLPAIDLFSFDWKIPLKEVIIEKEFIHYFARVRDHDWQKVAAYPYATWFPLWWAATRPLFQASFILILLSPVAMAAGYFSRRRKPAASFPFAPVFALWLVSFAGVLFWFFNAPDPRFGIAFIFVAGLLPFVFLLHGYFLPYRKPITISVILGLSVLVLLDLRDDVYQLRRNPAQVKQKLLLPEKLQTVPLRSEMVGKTRVYIPTRWLFCYDAPIPCTHVIYPGLELRGDDLSAGFRIRKESRKEPHSAR
jgi:hypothetical protein